MKSSLIFRFFLSAVLIFCLTAPPAILAQKGEAKKHFNTGMKHEAAEQWDLAAEAFTLAVAGSPKNPEYRLHLRRALFNASQMYMQKGRAAAEEKDYEGAYIAYRKAYGFDPVNELARSEMARMVYLQEELKKAESGETTPGSVNYIPAGQAGSQDQSGFRMPFQMETLRDLNYPNGIPLMQLVKDLAAGLRLNVLFDSQSQLENRQVRIELKDITSAKALDYVFLQENLFFQRVGPRTIMVVNNTRRNLFQQLVLRTFYLANASPKDVKTIVQTAIPPQPGRNQTIVLEDEATNSITVRDTEENIRLIGSLISSLDKDRAEVVLDVSIYEVNKNDLLQFGNQIGTASTLLNLGGAGLPVARRGSTEPITSNLPFPTVDIASVAIGLPISQIAALQTKGDTKLLASTQIHAFNNEESSARIGQRVPVRTASFAPINQGGGTGGNNNFLGDVYNYEQVGLTLKFKPIVFPNHDVQVLMEIESKDVAGALTDQPVFTERTIKGTARVQNNKTLLLASVAQGIETKSRTGLPLIGLIPIIGRLFTAPTRDNRHVDVVIAITPRVIRAPAIFPSDEAERPTGSLAIPTTGSLEAMIYDEERNAYLASLRRLPSSTNVQLPDVAINSQDSSPAYVRGAVPVNSEPANENSNAETVALVQPNGNLAPGLPAILRPIDSNSRNIEMGQTSASAAKVPEMPFATLNAEDNVNSSQGNEQQSSVVNVSLPADLPELKPGERLKIPVTALSSAPFRSAVLGINYDTSKIAVRDILYGNIFGSRLEGNIASPFLNQNGKMFISFSPNETSKELSGVLAYIEIEALEQGRPAITFEKAVMNFLGPEGLNFKVNF